MRLRECLRAVLKRFAVINVGRKGDAIVEANIKALAFYGIYDEAVSKSSKPTEFRK